MSVPPEANPYNHHDSPIVLPPSYPLIDGKPLVIDLFCGLGGISLGLEMAGFQTILGTDIHEPSMKVFMRSHKRATGILGDIRKMIDPGSNSRSILVDECKKILNGRKLDVLAAGIPCQGFSRMNQKRSKEDKRNYLFMYFMEVASYLHPSVIFIENVPGMKDLSRGKFVKDIKDSLRELGYVVKSKEMDASNYLVPQYRTRLLFLGHDPKLNIPFPLPRRDRFTVHDAISDLPHIEENRVLRTSRDRPTVFNR